MTDITLTRTLDAPPELVWRAWTDPTLTARWWHPADVDVRPGSVEIDLREGGSYSYTMVSGDQEWPTGGTYLEIREGELLRFTWCEAEDPDTEAPVATVTLEPVDEGRTEMTFVLTRVEDRDGVRDGWESAFDDELVPLLAEIR